MTEFKPIRALPEPAPYTDKDVLVIFGEVFQRGYVNGLIDEAEKAGMKVIYSTVGRRDSEGNLRALTDEELAEKKHAPIINVPLEAGFDLETSSQGRSPVDQLKGVKLSEWESAKMNWDEVKESRQKGTERFRAHTKQWVDALHQHLPEDGNIIFAHTMAGGFPRAKVVMPATNRAFKGFGERYASSEQLWNSDIGRFCEQNFNDVTGETFHHLIDLTAELRKSWEARGKKVSYLAYGYHGTDAWTDEGYVWQSYSPYLQGFAKKRLENIAEEAMTKGIKACVFNSPEILTNSSSIFLGVEVSLYPLLGALRQEAANQSEGLLGECASLLKEEHSIDEILQDTNSYLKSDIIRQWSDFKAWPQHNGPEQMEMMRKASSRLIDMHKDGKELITHRLSEVVFRACGHLMFDMSWNLTEPVLWVGHDIVAKSFAEKN